MNLTHISLAILSFIISINILIILTVSILHRGNNNEKSSNRVDWDSCNHCGADLFHAEGCSWLDRRDN